MRLYTALLKANAEPVLVRDGFAWGALVCGPVWLAAHRAWIAAAVSLAGFILIATLAPTAAIPVLAAGLAVLLGLTGHDLRLWSLENRGFLPVHVVAAANADAAFGRLLAHRPDLAARFQPRLG